MSQTVSCPQGIPTWPRLQGWLSEHGQALQMRMIDGQLAFPDEEPPETWHELRVALCGVMVTIRRNTQGVELVTWGNADETMRLAWETLARAFAELGRM